ncbi:MAG: outer membrane protein assembly factor [Scytonema sp. PMC 1069.18]|nr:outer membrane protein assembly factor [Scytonema sp. PMC 1069.18]MEC4883869.1 outer membrane protein assembly factor [Scytonema sp. PMC 1070.18]
MRFSSAAIFTLATLAAGNTTQQAIAVPSNTPTQNEQADDLVVPAIENTPTRLEAISKPETVVVEQFSQKQNREQSNKGNDVPSSTSSSSPVTPVTENDLVVTATDVQIVGATEELQQIIRSVIKTQAGGETSQTQMQKDVAAILDTGLFIDARANSTTTPDGLSVVYQVKPVFVSSIQLSGAKALTYQVAREPFQPLIGKAISPKALKEAVQQINKWYADNSYNAARVLSITPSREGILTVNVAEGVVGEVQFRFVNQDGQTVDDKGKPVKGRTKPEFLRQQIKLKPGHPLQESLVKQDLEKLYGTGLFESVNVALEGDATKLIVVYQLKETGARSVNVGGNYNADQGIVGTLTYRDQNVGGTSDSLSGNLQVGRRDFEFDGKFTSPYRDTNADRLGYSVNLFRKRGLSDTFDGDIKLLDGDRVREGRIGGSVSLQRPIDDWDTSLGFNYTRVSIRDRDGHITPTDEKGNQLSFSGTGIDDLTTVSLTAVKDRRDNPLNPTQGSIIKLSTEQSLPFGEGDISMNRLRANYSQFTPVKLFDSQKPQVFALNLQAGTVIGDLPPYESFNLGGPNSVRGYDGGDIGSGRTYVLASAEYRFPIPIWDALGGVVFADFASDLGTGETVLGNPAGVRDKPGTGFGYGAGIRLNSPLGLIRADFGMNDQGESRLHFGIGQRF